MSEEHTVQKGAHERTYLAVGKRRDRGGACVEMEGAGTVVAVLEEDIGEVEAGIGTPVEGDAHAGDPEVGNTPCSRAREGPQNAVTSDLRESCGREELSDTKRMRSSAHQDVPAPYFVWRE